jgi:DNA polymerase-3 subunit epsilon
LTFVATGFDLETTGLNEPEHRIIEIALILYDLDSRVELGRLVRRFNPGRPIDPKAQEVHGISFDQVSHLPLIEDDKPAVHLIQQILAKSDIVVAHNGQDFDVPFLQREFARIGQPLPAIHLVDTMKQGRWATPLGKVPNLGELCFACDVPYDPSQAHAADYDVQRMMDCFFRAYPLGFYTLPQSRALQAA